MAQEKEGSIEPTKEVTNPKTDEKLSTESWLKSKYNFRWNVYLSQAEMRENSNDPWKIVDDREVHTLYWQLKKRKNEVHVIGRDELFSLLQNREFTNDFNPLKSYLEGLPKWDGHDYLKDLCDTIILLDKTVEERKFFDECVRRWMLAMVTGVLDSDIINGLFFILAGGQGIGKSTWIANLLPKELRDYVYSGGINPRNKDTTIRMAQRIIIDNDELASLSPKATKEFKALITKKNIVERLSHRRNDSNMDRIASFIGSVNDDKFLSDMTGNRRYLAFSVEDIDYRNSHNYDGLYSQLYHYYNEDKGKRGEAVKNKYWFDGGENAYITKRNEGFRVKTALEEIIETVFAVPKDKLNSTDRMNGSQIIAYLQGEGYKFQLNNTSNREAGRIMTALGFEKIKQQYALDIVPKGKRNLSDSTADEVIDSLAKENNFISQLEDTSEDEKMLQDIADYDKRQL